MTTYTESRNAKLYFEALVGITSILEREDNYSVFGLMPKEHAVKKFLHFHYMTDEMRARILNEIKVEITSRFTEDQMDVLCGSFDDVDLCPDWLWG